MNRPTAYWVNEPRFDLALALVGVGGAVAAAQFGIDPLASLDEAARHDLALKVPPQLIGIIEEARRDGIDGFTLEYSRGLVMASFSSRNHAGEIDPLSVVGCQA